MKIKLKNTIGLYPTPVIVVGTMNEAKPTWTLVAHIGIVSHDRILISLAKNHFINHLIKSNKKLSINVINKDLLPQADFCGMNSGSKVDKSNVFQYEVLDNVPYINDSPLAMISEIESIVFVGDFENMILKVSDTIIDSSSLNENGKIDIQKVNPILFSMPSYEYLTLGEKKFKCLSLGRQWK